MGCGCGGKKTAATAATREAAQQRQAAKRDPKTYWNGPPKKPKTA